MFRKRHDREAYTLHECLQAEREGTAHASYVVNVYATEPSRATVFSGTEKSVYIIEHKRYRYESEGARLPVSRTLCKAETHTVYDDEAQAWRHILERAQRKAKTYAELSEQERATAMRAAGEYERLMKGQR